MHLLPPVFVLFFASKTERYEPEAYVGALKFIQHQLEAWTLFYSLFKISAITSPITLSMLSIYLWKLQHYVHINSELSTYAGPLTRELWGSSLLVQLVAKYRNRGKTKYTLNLKMQLDSHSILHEHLRDCQILKMHFSHQKTYFFNCNFNHFPTMLSELHSHNFLLSTTEYISSSN